MEKEGFIRSINFLQSKGLVLGKLVTDRHVQLVKYIREQLPTTEHHFDVWHVAKGNTLVCNMKESYNSRNPQLQNKHT